MTTPLNIFAIDYDGCFLLARLIENKLVHAKDVKELIADPMNTDLVSELVEAARRGEKVIITVGSNRQDGISDYGNSMAREASHKKPEKTSSPSVFSALPELAKVVKRLAEDESYAVPSGAKAIKNANVYFDRILAADVYQDKHFGLSFFKYMREDWIKKGIAQTEDSPIPDGTEAFFDQTKISTIYTQLHYFAEKYPDTPIVFTFKDDRKDILDGLMQFYQKNTHLMPKNITLVLEQKNHSPLAPHEVFDKTEIIGEGLIDYDYRTTTIAMIEIIHRMNNRKPLNLSDMSAGWQIDPSRDEYVDLAEIDMPDMQALFQDKVFANAINEFKQLRLATVIADLETYRAELNERRDSGIKKFFALFNDSAKHHLASIPKKLKAIDKLINVLNGKDVSPFTGEERRLLKKEKIYQNSLDVFNRVVKSMFMAKQLQPKDAVPIDDELARERGQGVILV